LFRPQITVSVCDDAPLVPPLHLTESVGHVPVHGDVIVTATGADIAVHQPTLSRLSEPSCCSENDDRLA